MKHYKKIVRDWFGENAQISRKNDKLYVKIKCNENALYYWIMQYSDCVNVISPTSFVEKNKRRFKERTRTL